MAEERQYNNMVGKPLFDILSKLPSKSLLRFRCVSKLWCEYIDDSYFVSVHDKQVIEDPTPIMVYKNYIAKTLCFHTFESDTITNNVLKAKNKVGVLEFVDKKLLEIVGSCNGLVLVTTYDDQDVTITFTVIHPINQQRYVLPKLTFRFTDFIYLESYGFGFGFDSSTNTLKMVYIKSNNDNDHCTMVHVFGTNSWHTIPHVPSYGIYGKAIFAHGCLHWLACYNSEDGTRQVIWFDVKNEEFGLSKPPKTISKPSKRHSNHPSDDHLVNLDGQLGYFSNETTEVWVLNHKKEWVLHCNLEDHDLPDYYIKVLGCLNKAGDIIIKVTNWDTGKEMFYIYNLKNRVTHEARIHGLDLEVGSKMDMVLFPNSLCDIITNSSLIKKTA